MKYIKRTAALVLSVLTLISAAVSVSAKEIEYAPYEGYEYNADSESVAAPVSYIQSDKITYTDMGLAEPIGEAQDMYIKDGILYLLDSGNGRILELDGNYRVKRIHNGFTNGGEAVDFKDAMGFTVAKNGDLYVADTQNSRILIANKQDKIIRIIEKPEAASVGFDFTFDVSKLVINRQGMIYAVAKSINDGAFAFSPDGEFQHFFARNSVVKTIDVILNFFRKRFLTREQLLKTMSHTPVTIANFDIDDDGFVYTISGSEQSSGASAVNKINFKGENIFETSGIIETFGDLEWDRKKVNSKYTSFSDVEVDDEGCISLLDIGRGKVFQYTGDGQLIGVFGCFGEQTGSFFTPVAIESRGQKILVLEKSGTLLEFEPTYYTECLRKAFLNLDSSDASLAVDEWNEVLKLNSNSLYPYYGLGIAYEKQGNYKKAMECFKISSSHKEYSDAFREYRKEFISKNILYIALGIIALAALIAAGVSLLRKRKRVADTSAYSALESKYTLPIYTLFNPGDGFEQFKYRRELIAVPMACGIIAIMFLVNVFKYFCTGYAFNENDPADYSVFSTFISSVAIYILFVVGNWAVCTLFDGNGSIKEIACVTAYALIPYILCSFIGTVLSNVLVLDEAILISVITAIGVIWSAIILFAGLCAVNQYYAGKNIATIFLTIIAMAVIALIVFLFISLMQQLIYFVNSVIDEVQLL